MRIIAGKFKGRILKIPKGLKVHPTQDAVKEALFNILGARVSGASFLELFAGSGNVGMEALSRGAKTVYFVENNPLCLKTIEENLKRIGIACSYGFVLPKDQKQVAARLLPFNAEEAISQFCQKKQKFDIVFLDPPYYRDKAKNCLIKIYHYDILRPRSWVIIEHNKQQILPHLLLKLRLISSKRYGETVLSFYKKQG